MKPNHISSNGLSRLLGLCGCAAVLLAGCVERSVAQDTITYRFSFWVMACMAAAGALAIYASRYVPKRTDGWYRFTPKIRWGLIFTGAAAIFVNVVMCFNSVALSPDGFTLTVGFLGEKVHRIKYHDLERIELVKQETGIGRKRRAHFYFICFAKSGAADKVPIEGTCMQAALPEIMKSLAAARIPVLDKTQE